MSQNDNNQDRNEQFAQQLLDSYFLFRRPLPEEGFIQENKTTIQIMDDLSTMMAISAEAVVGYMLDHDYSPTTEQDGTVSWAIWRQV
jgi:hypothetical protein